MARRAQFGEQLGAIAGVIIVVYSGLLGVALAAVFALFSPSELLGSKFRVAAIAGAVAALALLVCTLRMRAGIRSFVAYLLVLVTVFGAALEAYFARDVFMDPRRAAALAAGHPYERGFPQDVARALRHADPGVRVSVPLAQFYANPLQVGEQSLIVLGGAPLATTVHCNELGVTSVYLADEFGFNNPTGLWNQVPLDVLLIGDSFTQGACVPPDQTLAANIRKTYQRTLSLGRDGAGPLLQLAALREYGRHLRPTAVVWFYAEENDLADLMLEVRTPALAAYLQSDFSQRLFEQQAAIGPLMDRRVDQLLVDYELRRWIPFRATRQMLHNRAPPVEPILAFPPGPTEKAEPAEPWIFKGVMQAVRRELDMLHSYPLFVFLPAFSSVAGRAPAAVAARARVIEEAERAGFAIIDAEDTFRSAGGAMQFFPFKMMGHYTPEGYALLAQAVTAKLATTIHTRR